MLTFIFAVVVYLTVGVTLTNVALLYLDEGADADELFVATTVWPYTLYLYLSIKVGRHVGAVLSWYRNLRNQ